MADDIGQLLDDWCWYRIDFTLQRKPEVSRQPRAKGLPHPAEVLRAFAKGARMQLAREVLALHQHHFRVHMPEAHYNARLHQQERWSAYTNASIDSAAALGDALQQYAHLTANSSHFELVAPPRVRQRSLAALQKENPIATGDDHGEIALRFRLPLPHRRIPGRAVHAISQDRWLANLKSNIATRSTRALPGISTASLSIQSQYMHFTKLHHKSRLTGYLVPISGLVGPMFVCGRLDQVCPWLLLGHELGFFVPQKMIEAEFGGGSAELFMDGCQHLDEFFPNSGTMHQVLQQLLDEDDDAQQHFAEQYGAEYTTQDFVEKLATQIREGSYQPQPAKQISIAKSSGGQRDIELLALEDRVVHKALHKLLAKPWDALFEPQSIGFRKGHARNEAIAKIQAAIADGYTTILESDIQDFFPSVNHGVLRDQLVQYVPAADRRTMRCINQVIGMPFLRHAQVEPRTQGLPTGSPLSPLLANLYLDKFDEWVHRQGVRMVRFGDDFLVFCRDREQAERLLQQSKAQLSLIGLQINADKTGILDASDGFEFLGYSFDGGETQLENPLLERKRKPLYITGMYNYVGLSHERVFVRQADQRKQYVPLRRVQEINVVGAATFSTALMAACTQRKIPITLSLNSGYYQTTIKPDSRKWFDTSYLHGQRYYQLPPKTHLQYARQLVLAKVGNSQNWLATRPGARANPHWKELQALFTQIDRAADIESLRGYEGQCANLSYALIGDQIQAPEVQFRGRNRRKNDLPNVLWNFGYYMLFARINSRIRSAGLNPYLGFLHSEHDNYESLVCDIEEIFRFEVDRLVLKVLNRRMIKPADVSMTGKRLQLSGPARKVFVNEFEKRMQSLGHYLRNGRMITVAQAIDIQVEWLRLWAIQDKNFETMEWRALAG